MLPLLLSFVLSTLLINVECQQNVQTIPLYRAQSSANSANAQQQQQQQQQPQQQQPQQQLLTPQQQQQLLQQLAQLQAQQQQAGQQQQFVVSPQQAPQQQQFTFIPQQQAPQQQFFDPNQQLAPQQQFFDPNQQAQQQFFQPQPQQFIPQTQQFAPQPQPQPQPQQQQFAPQPQPAQQQLQPQAQPQPQQSAPPSPGAPQISWGKCPQLEPSDREKMTKATVITKCLETTSLPENITRETVELHREQIAACALQSEGWFTSQGAYDFLKAENEIKNKKLDKQIEGQVLNYHKQCKAESEEKFPAAKSNVIGQIQLYQACMDYFISDVCGIEVNEPEAPQFTGSQF